MDHMTDSKPELTLKETVELSQKLLQVKVKHVKAKKKSPKKLKVLKLEEKSLPNLTKYS